MDAKRYRQIRQLFDAVQEQAPEQRSRYLAEAGTGDQELRDEVRRLLAASDSRTEVFEQPPIVRDGPGPLQRWEGRRLGPYQILRELGEGGMGIVYLARRADGAFQKEVAIKIVRQQLATPQFLQRFQRERDILAKLEHPNIARLLDGGTSPPFLAMEYVKGEPLLTFADSRKLSYDARVALLRQIASAVDYAHRQGVIHRDLKPANIFVTADGEVKLLDFGIAAWQESEHETEVSPTLAMSPAYASPEQVRGDKTNSTTDIYLLGLVGYELLAGMPPFRLEEAAIEEVFRTVLEETPPAPSIAVRESRTPSPADLGKRRQMAPAELVHRLEQADTTLLRALSKRREDRPASAAALLAELDLRSEPRRTVPRWVEALVRQWDFIAFQVCFLGFVIAGGIRLSPVAWSAYIWASVMALLRRFGILTRLYALSSTFVIAAGLSSLVLGTAITGATRQEVVRRLNGGLAILVGFVVFDIARYYLRRSSTLGKPLLSPAGKNWGRVWAIVVAAAAVWFAFEFSSGHANRITATALYATGFWFSWKVSLKPLEIRERGLVLPTALLPWSSIKSYSWLSPTLLDLRLHSTILRSVAYTRAQVRREDHESVQALLQNWLLEAPGSEVDLDVSSDNQLPRHRV